MDAFEKWLAEIGLASYAQTFAENEIDFSVVATLTEEDLRELGLSLGARRKFLLAAAALDAHRVSEQQVAQPAMSSQMQTLAASGERRQLTVMFCDLVGSTALGEKLDPEEFRALLHQYRSTCGDVIKRYDGFIARYVGDGILTYFGWPTAHEDDAERSVRAALDIVASIKQVSGKDRLAVRLGIATGAVVVGEQAGEGDQSKLAIGSTPNLAAHLQGLAAPEEVVIAASTRRLIGSAFELTDLGDQELKGISEPVHAWRVLGVGEAPSRFEAMHGAQLTPLVGREQEVGLLLDRWELSREGEGQVVLLGGEPGIGKSRIVSAFWGRLQNQGAQALRFQCSPYYASSAFHPSIENFERALKFDRNESPDSKLDKLEALLVTQCGRPKQDARYIGAMLSLPVDPRYGTLQMTPQRFKDETLRALVELTEAAARKQPTVAFFEDAHWADPTSLEVLDLLIGRLPQVPLLLLVTHRPEFQSRWSHYGHVAALNLSKLTRTQSAAMVVKLTMGKALPADLLEQILTKTDGIPLFVEELTQSVLESNELRDVGERYEYASASRSISVPTTLRDSLMARLDQYPLAKQIAQIGAVIGREFSYELIEAVAGKSPAALDEALRQLIDSGLAFRRGAASNASYIFKHALVHDAAYDSLLKSRRQALHAAIAEAIKARRQDAELVQPELLAHHLTHAGASEAAIVLWLRAGEQALARVALEEGISHLEKGLALALAMPSSERRERMELDLRIALGRAWMSLKGWPARESGHHFEAALALAESRGLADDLVPILGGLWTNTLARAELARCMQLIDRMFQAASDQQNVELRVFASMAAAACCIWMGDFARSLEHAQHALALYDEEKHHRLTDILIHNLRTRLWVYRGHCQWILGYPDRAADTIDETIAHARSYPTPFDIGFALTVGVQVFAYRREFDRVRLLSQETEQLGHEHRLPFFSNCLAQMYLGIASIHQGEVEKGVRRLQAGLEIWERTGGRLDVPYVRLGLAQGMIERGDCDGALQLLSELVEQVNRPERQERIHYAEILRLQGWAWFLKGKPESAEKCYLASLDCAREQQAKSWELRTSTSLALLWQAQGKPKEAYELLQPIYNWFTEGFDTKDLKEAKALLVELAAAS